MKKCIYWTSLVICLLSNSNLVAQNNIQLPDHFDEYVEKVMKTFEVPGMSIAIVKDNQILVSKGYGVKKINTSDKVDANTLFPIASNSKAFTATMLALLVEEGKIEWDKPVVHYLPWFKTSDPYVTANLSVKDLLVHRSGIAPYAGDLLQFPPSNYSREEIVRKIQYIPLVSSFRNTYAYDNILYLAAGELIKAVTGKEWEENVKERILQPIGMNTTTTRISEFGKSQNRSSSHARFDGVVKEVKNFTEFGAGEVTNPAGGMAYNANDMAKWLMTQLDSGRAQNGKELFKKNTAIELWKGVTPMNPSRLPDHLKPAQMHYQSYALGFVTYNYRSERMVAHSGKLDGFVSRVAFIPSMNIGIAVLTNQEEGGAILSIIHHIMDHFLKVPPFNWVEGYKNEQLANFERIKRIEASDKQTRNTNSKPSLDLKAYIGTYRDKWYGDVKINLVNNQLNIDFTHSNGLKGYLEHWQYDTFIVRWKNRELKADAYITFSLNPDGSIDQVKMKAVSPITDVSYDFHNLQLKPVK